MRSAFGGTPIAAQIEELSKKPHVIIGTPGRIIDLLEFNRMFGKTNQEILNKIVEYYTFSSLCI